MAALSQHLLRDCTPAVEWSSHQEAGLTIASSKESVTVSSRQGGRHPPPVIHGCSERAQALPLKEGWHKAFRPTVNNIISGEKVKREFSDDGRQSCLPPSLHPSSPSPTLGILPSISCFCPLNRQVRSFMCCRPENNYDCSHLTRGESKSVRHS